MLINKISTEKFEEVKFNSLAVILLVFIICNLVIYMLITYRVYCFVFVLRQLSGFA